MKVVNKVGAITASEEELNVLFKEILDGIRDDINEAQDNVQLYRDAIDSATTGGKELYGPLYNDALKIKNAVRGKQLDFLNMFKDRVTKKEILKANAGPAKEFDYDHMELNRMIEEVSMGKSLETKPVIDLQEQKEKVFIEHEDINEEEDEIDLEDEE